MTLNFFFMLAQQNRMFFSGMSYSINSGAFSRMQHLNVHTGLTLGKRHFIEIGTGFHSQFVKTTEVVHDFGYWTSNLTWKYQFFSNKNWLLTPIFSAEAGLGYPNKTDVQFVQYGQFSSNTEPGYGNYPFRLANYFRTQIAANLNFNQFGFQAGGGPAINKILSTEGGSGRAKLFWMASISCSYFWRTKN
jgi:hypothetical protein